MWKGKGVIYQGCLEEKRNDLQCVEGRRGDLQGKSGRGMIYRVCERDKG